MLAGATHKEGFALYGHAAAIVGVALGHEPINGILESVKF